MCSEHHIISISRAETGLRCILYANIEGKGFTNTI